MKPLRDVSCYHVLVSMCLCLCVSGERGAVGADPLAPVAACSEKEGAEAEPDKVAPEAPEEKPPVEGVTPKQNPAMLTTNTVLPKKPAISAAPAGATPTPASANPSQPTANGPTRIPQRRGPLNLTLDLSVTNSWSSDWEVLGKPSYAESDSPDVAAELRPAGVGATSPGAVSGFPDQQSRCSSMLLYYFLGDPSMGHGEEGWHCTWRQLQGSHRARSTRTAFGSHLKISRDSAPVFESSLRSVQLIRTKTVTRLSITDVIVSSVHRFSLFYLEKYMLSW